MRSVSPVHGSGPVLSQVLAGICPGAWIGRISIVSGTTEPLAEFCPFVRGLGERNGESYLGQRTKVEEWVWDRRIETEIMSINTLS